MSSLHSGTNWMPSSATQAWRSTQVSNSPSSSRGRQHHHHSALRQGGLRRSSSAQDAVREQVPSCRHRDSACSPRCSTSCGCRVACSWTRPAWPARGDGCADVRDRLACLGQSQHGVRHSMHRWKGPPNRSGGPTRQGNPQSNRSHWRRCKW